MDKITDINFIKNFLETKIPGIRILTNEPMKLHTSFKIGGNADVFVMPESEDEIIAVLDAVKENRIPLTVIGNGSNLLVSDLGIEGVVLCIGKEFSGTAVDGDRIHVKAGTLLSRCANEALKNNLAGMEFASGIPGSIGGAVMMNAGAYGGEMKDITESTRYINSCGEICECIGENHLFGYRKSRFTKDDIILSCTLKLTFGNGEEIKAIMNDLNDKRRAKQPLEYPSAGSTFKRPEGYFAAKLIDDAGLRGYRVGDAMVSDKHCGFVVNMGNATCSQVLELMDDVKQIVHQKFGVTLEPEVRMIGRRG